MQSMSDTMLGAVLFVATLLIAFGLDMLFGPLAVLLIAAAIIAAGLGMKRDWISYIGGLVISAGLTYDVVLDTVQSGSIFAGLFAVAMLGAVAVCAVISAQKLQSGL